ncbi:MAG TPA: roadblock/LC7 domain-containing protein [Myxococcales bacterium]
MPFRRALTTLVERARGARGAIFCDQEGESVELVVRDRALSEYDMKVFGAQLAAVWLDLQANSRECGAGGIVELRLWCEEGTLLCRSLPEGYYVVLLVAKGAPSAPAAFLLRNAAGEMAREM